MTLIGGGALNFLKKTNLFHMAYSQFFLDIFQQEYQNQKDGQCRVAEREIQMVPAYRLNEILISKRKDDGDTYILL